MGAIAADQWPTQIGDQWSTDVVQPPFSGVPAVNWGDQAAVNTDVWDTAAAPPQGIDVTVPAPIGWE
ncbi:hypothetical protein DITRI_Ditri02bG0065100 [Diplodiscus trichospermus]